VVLAASILSKTGHILMSRQFLTMGKIRIEGLLAAFPKLLGTDSQHTFVETEAVRYVYQPIEQLYLVLVTNKLSNIIEDLETLKLLAKIIPEYSEGYSEANIEAAAFDLIFAFDEVINLGYKETLSLSQVKQFIEMDSHEERLHKIIMASKMDEARLSAQKKAEEIDKRKQELAKLSAMVNPTNSYTDYSSFPFKDTTSADGEETSPPPRVTRATDVDDETGEPDERTTPKIPKAKDKKKDHQVKRMILGKGNKTQDDFLTKLSKEEKFQIQEEQPGADTKQTENPQDKPEPGEHTEQTENPQDKPIEEEQPTLEQPTLSMDKFLSDSGLSDLKVILDELDFNDLEVLQSLTKTELFAALKEKNVTLGKLQKLWIKLHPQG